MDSLTSPGIVGMWSRFRFDQMTTAKAILVAIAVAYVTSIGGYNAPLLIPDEFGYLSAAAYFSGYDWSAVTKGMLWYSFGYSVLLTPFFTLSDPVSWYRVAQVVNILLLACAVPVMVNVLRQAGPRSQAPSTAWWAMLVVLLYPAVFFYAKTATPETLILVLSWVAALLLARAVRAEKAGSDTVLLGAVVAAMYFVHSRQLGTMMAAFACVVLIGLVRGRTTKVVASFLLGAIPVLIAGQLVKGYLIKNLYLGAVHGVQQSLVAMIELKLGQIMSWEGFKSLLGVVSGQLTYLVVSSLGIAVVGIVWACSTLLRNRVSAIDARSVVLIFFMLSLAGTSAISMMAMSVPGLPHHVFYGRYIEPAMMPLLALGVAALVQGEGRWRWAWIAGALCFIVLTPVAMRLASKLPAGNTYWILITGLFPFRSPQWSLDLKLLTVGYFGSLLALSIFWRWGKTVGVVAVCSLFALSTLDLVRTFAYADESRQFTYTAYHESGGNESNLVGYVVGSDPTFMRGLVQLANPHSKTIVFPQSALGSLSDLSLPRDRQIELIDATGAKVSHHLCDATDRRAIDCQTLVSNPLRESVKLTWPSGASSGLGIASPSGLRLTLQQLSGWPFLRALRINLVDARQPVVLETVAERAGSYRLVTFVTTKDQPDKWLGDRREVVSVRAGRSRKTVFTYIPLRHYNATPLSPGRYVAHWVVAHPDGYDWSTHVALSLVVK